jgi:virulence-associated protein VapD
MTKQIWTQGSVYLNVFSQRAHQSYNTAENQESLASKSIKVHWFLRQNKENAYIKI